MFVVPKGIEHKPFAEKDRVACFVQTPRSASPFILPKTVVKE
jgi:hypothetical protein